MEKSGAWFREATKLQPDYAAAWAGLADYYGEGVAGNVLDPRTSLGPMEEAAQRALAASRRRAFWIDIAFVVAGIVVFLAR